MESVSVVMGALRYEFGMQLRRGSVWVVLALVSTLPIALWIGLAGSALHAHYSPELHELLPPSQSDGILGWAQVGTMLLPVGVGLVLADRLARDHSTHVDEILDTLPGRLGARLLGKYLGATLATLVPIALIYTGVVAFILSQVPDARGIPLAAAAFAAILLPGALFAAGFSIAVPVAIKVPVYQFLFLGYWFWANLMTPKIGLPSPVGTILNATGPWAQEGLFHFDWAFLRLHATPAQAYASIALLIGLGVAALVGAWLYLRWQQAQH
jgi:ABC-2 type transport system permease protein